MFWVHISKFTVFYMYIFTPIYFQNQKVIVNHNYQYLINIYRVQVGTYGCIWVLMGVLIQNNDKIGKVGTGGACACMIWGPGWPGNFPVHHVCTHFAQKSSKRVAITQDMNQDPHNTCKQLNQGRRDPEVSNNLSSQ